MIKYILTEFKKANTLPKNRKAFLSGFLLFTLFFLLFFLESRQTLRLLDPTITVFLQSFTPRFLDGPLSMLSLLGSFEITSLTVLLIAIWVFRKEKKIFFALIFFGMILIFEFIGKYGLYHPNPPRMFFRYDLPFTFPTSYVDSGNSFPSGHVGRTMFIAVVGIFFIKKYLKKPLFLTALILIYVLTMTLSRVYLGEHWASDTIGGIFLGGALGFFTISYF